MTKRHAAQLYKRLQFLGYQAFEIKRMVEEAIGANNIEGASVQELVKAIKAMQRYEKLGAQFLEMYSK